MALGFAAIVIQGIIVSSLLASTSRPGSTLTDVFAICVPLMALIWTAQVLAHAAKFDVQIGPFIAIESAYFILQAILVSLALAAAMSLAR